MSWFNPKAFAAGALGELNNIIDTNFEEAKTYEEEQRELFKSSKIEIGRRRSIVGGLVTVAKKLGDMGVSKAAIQAAHSSGPQGLLNLQKLIIDENRRRVNISGQGGKLSADDINAMITMGGMAEAQNPEFEKMDYNTFFERSMNLGGGGTPEVAPKRNFLQEALGMGAKKAAIAKLDAEMGGSGLSILDMNEAAQRDAYNSLMPGSYATFMANPFFEEGKELKEFNSLDRLLDSNLKYDETYSDIGAQSGEVDVETIKAQQRAYKQSLRVPYIAGQIKKYGSDAIDNSLINYKDIIGSDNLNKILMNNDLPILEQQQFESDLSRKGDIVTLPMGEGRQAIVTMGPSGPLSIQTVNKNNPNDGSTINDPNNMQNFLEGLVKSGFISENSLTKSQEDVATYYDNMQTSTDTAFTDPNTGELLGAEFLSPDVLAATQAYREGPDSFKPAINKADELSAQELKGLMKKEDPAKANIEKFNKENKEFMSGILESQEGSLGVKLSDIDEEGQEDITNSNELLVDIVNMAEDNPKHKALVEKFFGPDAPAPNATTFRQFQNALATSGSSSGDLEANQRIRVKRDALSESVTRLGDLLLRGGEPAFSLIGETNSVWSGLKSAYTFISEFETDKVRNRRLAKEAGE